MDPEEAQRLLFLVGRIGVFSVCYKRGTLADLRFDESMRLGEDMVFLSSFLEKCERIFFLEDRLYHRRQRISSAVNNMTDFLGSADRMAGAYSALGKKYPSLLPLTDRLTLCCLAPAIVWAERFPADRSLAAKNKRLAWRLIRRYFPRRFSIKALAILCCPFLYRRYRCFHRKRKEKKYFR
ncbi:MAG: hypothetical protein LBQ15_08265 [Clostridium sp.]|jgi:hypothetical protein|nr:hypothetical protein [Clostridium sp.]